MIFSKIWPKIWQRYVFFEYLKFFTLFLCGFYILYVVLDYSAHMQDFLSNKSIPLVKIIKYYLFQFIKRADILLPLALLLSTIKILCHFNASKELVAFQSGGLTLKNLLTPIFFLGTLCCLTNLAIMEFAATPSLNFIDQFYDAHLRHSFRGNRQEPIHVLHLADQSKLIYQYYDSQLHAFFDVIWIRSSEDLWRMKTLSADPLQPEGRFVDHLVKANEGAFEKTESYDAYSFTELTWDSKLPRKGFIPFENHSISQLFALLKDKSPHPSYETFEILSQFLFKISMPFLCLLVILVAAPFCLIYSRRIPYFFIYTIGLFSFVAFIALMDALIILAENNTLSPPLAILLPQVGLFGVFGWKFAKI